MRQAAQDLALVYSSDRGSLGPAHPLPVPQKRQAFAETEFPEKRTGMVDSQRHDPTSTQERLRAIEASSANEVEQSTSSSPFPQQGQTAQPAGRSRGQLEQVHRTKISLASGASTFGLFGSKAVRGTRNGDRSILIIGALLLLALGLLAGWYGLNNSTGVAGVGGSSQATIDTANEPKYPEYPLFDVAEASALPTGQPNTDAEDHKVRAAKGRSVETLPQTALSSKLRLSDGSPAEVAASPRTTELSKALRDPVPSLTASSGSGPAPRLDERNANPVNANPVIDTSQDSVLHPLKTVNPEYPKIAKLRQVEGEVLLRLQVGTEGNVKQVSTVSGNVLLREAAERAAWQWQYPANQLTSSRPTLVRIIFKLNSESVK
jgi:TonB family protein